MTARGYVLTYAFLLLAVPVVFLTANMGLGEVSVTVISWAAWFVPVILWRGKGFSFVNHLASQVRPSLSGCLNVTLVYIFPMLLWLHFRALFMRPTSS